MKKYFSIAIRLLFLAVIAGALLIFERELLWKAQEENLFLCTTDFLKQQMVVAGGFLTWLGTWFTQFFFHPWMGVLMLCAWWWLLMWLTKRTFRVPSQWVVVLFIPVILILTTITDLGYWIYILKLRGHFFVTTIGTCAVVALLWAFRSLSEKVHSMTKVKSWLQPLFIVITCVVGYPLLGVYGLAATLLMGLWSWRLKSVGSWWQALINSLFAVASAWLIPLLCYRQIYHETNIEDIYSAELPQYIVIENFTNYYIPFALLALFYALAVLFPRHLPKIVEKANIIVSGVIVLLLGYSTYHFWFKDENFHHELAMQHCIAQLDWQGVLDEAATQEDEPTRSIVMMRNLALARTGRQGNEMYRYKNGSKISNAPYTMRMMLVSGPLIYYHYGMTNFCTRLCIEMGVEFGWRAENIKFLARCALLNGEKQLTLKYLNILRQTMFFSEWADEVEALYGNDKAIGTHPEMAFVKNMMHYDNKLAADQGFPETFLMNLLSRSTYTNDSTETANPYSLLFQEQTLLASMWTKDVAAFWKHLNDYIRLHPNQDLPIHYQEAALHYLSLEGRNDFGNWPFNKNVLETFQRFYEMTSQYDNMDVEVVRKALYPLFGKTYYYDYYLMNNLPQY